MVACSPCSLCREGPAQSGAERVMGVGRGCGAGGASGARGWVDGWGGQGRKESARVPNQQEMNIGDRSAGASSRNEGKSLQMLQGQPAWTPPSGGKKRSVGIVSESGRPPSIEELRVHRAADLGNQARVALCAGFALTHRLGLKDRRQRDAPQAQGCGLLLCTPLEYTGTTAM